ncbi:MAG: hypothetical protein HQK60_17765, partial [Deltaproteobacteria bacterium]|nr:hypothetical protein [Deltaproteobacteria bacterium]
ELAVAVLDETTPPSRAKKADEYAKVGDLYRRLKQKFKEEHNEPEASTWHYNEKEMLRKTEGLRWRSSSDRLTSLKTWLSFALLTIYYHSSGYAERPFKAGLWMLGLMMVYPVVISWCDLDFKHQTPAQVAAQVQTVRPGNAKRVSASGWNPWPDWCNYCYNTWTFKGQITVGAWQHIWWDKNPHFEPISPWGSLGIMVFAKLLIPLQAVFLILAVRNRFRR